MRLPGFTAEAATYGRAVLYMHGPNQNQSSADTVTSAFVRRLCPPGSATAGCRTGSRCIEPGGLWPHCHCLQCSGGPGGGSDWMDVLGL